MEYSVASTKSDRSSQAMRGKLEDHSDTSPAFLHAQQRIPALIKKGGIGINSNCSLISNPMLEQRYQLRHLNDGLATEVRRLMIEELYWAVEHDKLYTSKHFAKPGHKEYPLLLQEAFATGNPDTLEESLNVPGYFQAGSPRNAAQTFSWDEFNKYYMRALCLLAQVGPGYELVVARGRHSDHPKPQSSKLIGARKDPSRFLRGLREVPKVNPFGANSGLTLELRKR